MHIPKSQLKNLDVFRFVIVKKLLGIIVLGLLFSGNVFAKYIEIVCTPEEEFGADLKREKIWFKFNKPKYVFHFDEENLVITKMGLFSQKPLIPPKISILPMDI